jgi:hypothetical protein
MGLAISVGLLADLIVNDEEGAAHVGESLARVNGVLAENGLPAHVEPETLGKLGSRARCRGFSCSFLHYLRRFAAHASTMPDWKPTPFPEDDDPAHDLVVVDELTLFSSHLLCHSDCEGYYVPIDFPEPIFADEAIPGGMLGSSQGLLRELIAVAPFLGIQLSEGKLSDAEADRINQVAEAAGPFWIEHMVWIALFEATRLSIQHRAAICFC